jgi:hypothetical protein
MWAKYQGVCATPATAPALHCQNGNNSEPKVCFYHFAKLQGPPSYHRKQRSLLEFVVEGKRKWLYSFSRSSDESTRRANRYFIRECHQDSEKNLHNQDNGGRSEDCELTLVKLIQAEIFSHHKQQEVHDTFHCHLWKTLLDALLKHPMLISLCLD